MLGHYSSQAGACAVGALMLGCVYAGSQVNADSRDCDVDATPDSLVATDGVIDCDTEVEGGEVGAVDSRSPDSRSDARSATGDGYAYEIGGSCSTWEWFEGKTVPITDTSDYEDSVLMLLPDNRVLIGASESIYEPHSDSYFGIATIVGHRDFAVPVLLSDKTKVLVTGGSFDSGYSGTNVASVVDLTSNTETATTAMHARRMRHKAVLLDDGRVFVVGGWDWDAPAVPAAETFDPATRDWTATSPWTAEKGIDKPNVLRLSPDDYLVTTADWGCPAFRFSPSTGTWRETTTIPFGYWPDTLVALPDGTVLVTGFSECPGQPNPGPFFGTALYDPHTETWEHRAAMNHPRAHSFSFYQDCTGSVIVVGGDAIDGSGTPPPEVYEVAADVWRSIGGTQPTYLRTYTGSSAVMLNDGAIMYAFGRLGYTETIDMPLFYAPMGSAPSP